jgi:ABC-2 type transport system permease protein
MSVNEQTARGNSKMVPVTGTGWRRGLDNLLHGEFTQWFGTRMWWVQILIWFACINLVYLTASIGMRNDPTFDAIMIFCIFMGLAGPIGTTIVMQMAIVGETRSGTAAWILSKPVSRPAFVLSKLIGNGVGLGLTMILAQGVIAYLITGLVQGTWLPIPGFLAGLGVLYVNIIFYMTLALMLGAIFDHPAAVIGIPMAFLFVQQYIAGATPWLYKLLPWTLAVPLGDSAPSISASLMTGMPVGSYAPLAATLVESAIFLIVALRVFSREDL